MPEPEKDNNILIKQLMAASPHKMYANGFHSMVGAGDITTIFFCNDSPVGTLNLSYTTAKTFATQLVNAIQEFEKDTGQQIMTTDFISDKLSKKDQSE